MRNQLTCNNTFINRTEIDTGYIIQNSTNIAAIQNSGKNTDVIQIELQQILSGRFDQRKCGIRNGLYRKCNAGTDQIFKLILIIVKCLSSLVFNILCNHSLFLVLHVGRNKVVNSTNLQLFVFVIFGSIGRIVVMDFALNLSNKLNVMIA